MWGSLATSYAQITAGGNLASTPYFCLGLLANLAGLLRPVDDTSIILGVFGPFSPSQDGIPIGTLDDC